MVKRILLILLTIINVATITFFSTQTAEQSKQISSKLSERLVAPIIKKTDISLNETDIKVIGNERLRDFAHFFLFLTLGVLVYAVCKNIKIKFSLCTALVICVLYALFDELYQELLGQGRTFEFVDLLKDWAGSCSGITTNHIIHKKVYNTRQKQL